MARIVDLRTFSEERGHLTVIEQPDIGFEIKRVFYIYGVDDSVRGKHAHKKSIQALMSVKGSCIVAVNDGNSKGEFLLDKPSKCLILEPQDWHYMYNFTPDCVLEVLASEPFNPEDYVYDEPNERIEKPCFSIPSEEVTRPEAL